MGASVPEQQRVARWLSYVPYFQAHIAVRLENQEGNGQMDAGWMLPDSGPRWLCQVDPVLIYQKLTSGDGG